jgi:uncharacterized membrane protein
MRRDQGSVLLLILGLVVLAALLITVVIDVSSLYLERRNLIAAADGAALAGAQAIDQEAVYTSGLPSSGPVPLDKEEAEMSARQYIADSGLMADYPNLLVSVTTTATTIEVRLSAVVALPVVNGVTPGAKDGVTIEAVATARTAVIS